MLTVRSAITATSIGLGAIVPQDPLQATEMMFPVCPSEMPPAGANPNGTVRPWKTRIVLHAIFGVPVFNAGSTHGMAHSLLLQLVLSPVDL
jgi:hypothetical protein